MKDADWDDYIKRGPGFWGTWRRELEARPASTGDGGDAWTGIAFLLLVGLGLWVAYQLVLVIAKIYTLGISPYVYFYLAITEQFSFVILPIAVLFAASQFAILPVFVSNGGIIISFIYLALLPALNVLMYYCGLLALDIVPGLLGLEWALGWLSNQLPQDMSLGTSISGDLLAHAIPIGLVGQAFVAASGYVLLKALAYLRVCMNVASVAVQRAKENNVGRGLLVAAAVAILTASARLVTPPIDMPYGLQTGTLILTGMVLGWRLTAVAVVLWLCLMATGLPVFYDRAVTLRLMFGPMAGYCLGLILGGVVAGLRGTAIEWGQR